MSPKAAQAEANAAFKKNPVSASLSGLWPRLIGVLLKRVPKFGFLLGYSHFVGEGTPGFAAATCASICSAPFINPVRLVEKQQRAYFKQTGTSKPVMETLISSLKALPQPARRSITFDRGTEFTAWTHLKAGLGVAPWFCDPQSPWQKGTVENTNNRLRRYLPRKADPTVFTDRYLRSICDRLNNTPRKCLGYQTHTEVFRLNLMERVTSPR